MNEGSEDGVSTGVSSGNLVRCAECGCSSGLNWSAWIACRVDDLVGGEPPELAFFCPECAEREFGFGAV